MVTQKEVKKILPSVLLNQNHGFIEICYANLKMLTRNLNGGQEFTTFHRSLKCREEKNVSMTRNEDGDKAFTISIQTYNSVPKFKKGANCACLM